MTQEAISEKLYAPVLAALALANAPAGEPAEDEQKAARAIADILAAFAQARDETPALILAELRTQTAQIAQVFHLIEGMSGGGAIMTIAI